MTALSLPLFATLSEGLANAAKTVARWYRGRQAYHDLCLMDDRALSDIGLSRSDLRDASAVALFDDPTGQLARAAGVKRPFIGRGFPVLREVSSPNLQPLAASGKTELVR